MFPILLQHIKKNITNEHSPNEIELEICYNSPNFSFLTFQKRNSNIKEKHLDYKFIFFSKRWFSN